MSTISDFERLARAWLDDGPTQLSDRTLDAALEEVHLTPQRRALRVPWRFPNMLALSRATGIAAVALVAVVGAGGLIYLNSKAPGNAGATQAPTLTPAPTPNTPGITGWKRYTSAVYGITMSYPDDWSIYEKATSKYQPGDVLDGPYSDTFVNPEATDGDDIAMWVLQVPAPEGADLDSWEGLEAAYAAMCAKPADFAYVPCAADDPPTPMCLGDGACRAAIILLVSDERTPTGLFGDSETGVVTLYVMGREDSFPAAARYGGSITLLKSILAQVGVRAPRPGETPAGG